jgi:hypothetical protein
MSLAYGLRRGLREALCRRGENPVDLLGSGKRCRLAQGRANAVGHPARFQLSKEQALGPAHQRGN